MNLNEISSGFSKFSMMAHRHSAIVHHHRFWETLFYISLGINLVSFRLMDAVFTAVFLIGVFTREDISWRQKFGMENTKTNQLIFLFFLSCAIGYFRSFPLREEQMNDLFELRWGLSFYACYYAGLKLRKVSGSISLSSFITPAAIIYLFYLYFTKAPGWDFNALGRMQGLYDNPNHFALTIVLLWAFHLGTFFDFKVRDVQAYCIPLLTLTALTAALCLSSSRTSWLGALMSLIALNLIVRNRQAVFLLLLVTAAAFMMYSFNWLGLQDRVLYSLDTSLSGAQGTRIMAWKASWHIFLDYPIFGVGVEDVPRIFPEYYEKLGFPKNALILGNSHNQYLQLLAGTGLVGASAYLTLFISGFFFFKNAFNSRDKIEDKRLAIGGMLVIVALLFGSITDSPFRLHECRNYLIFLLGFSYGHLDLPRKTPYELQDQLPFEINQSAKS